LGGGGGGGDPFFPRRFFRFFPPDFQRPPFFRPNVGLVFFFFFPQWMTLWRSMTAEFCVVPFSGRFFPPVHVGGFFLHGFPFCPPQCFSFFPSASSFFSCPRTGFFLVFAFFPASCSAFFFRPSAFCPPFLDFFFSPLRVGDPVVADSVCFPL